MKIEQMEWKQLDEVGTGAPGLPQAQLVLAFGSIDFFRTSRAWDRLRERYPRAHLMACSTAGEIQGTNVQDQSLVATAIEFSSTRIRGVSAELESEEDSREVGKRLIQSLLGEDLRHVLVLSAGLKVNGSELVRGFNEHLPPNIKVTGGLAGDGGRFVETAVVSGRDQGKNLVAAVGFYGPRIRVAHGSMGGWDPFGLERVVTKSSGNVLYELDGKSALEIYKQYLGDQAKDLPGSGLLFPLALRQNAEDQQVVRTILGVDETTQSLTFAGNIPEGWYAQLMRANFDRLLQGAADAAQGCRDGRLGENPELALLISCVGRKLVLQQRIEEEVESVREILGPQAALTGFYSYGEISPFTPTARCELHNQTMTITAFRED